MEWPKRGRKHSSRKKNRKREQEGDLFMRALSEITRVAALDAVRNI